MTALCSLLEASLKNALGNGIKKVEKNESNTVIVQRRSIRLVRDMASGEVIHKEDLEVLRPCQAEGLPPYRMGEVLGKILRRAKARGQHLSFSDIE